MSYAFFITTSSGINLKSSIMVSPVLHSNLILSVASNISLPTVSIACFTFSASLALHPIQSWMV